MAVNVLVWATRPAAAGSVPVLASLSVVAACLYVPVDGWVLYRRPDVAGRFPAGSALVDLAFILLWIAATGLRHSPFRLLLLLGVISAPMRLPGAASLAITAAYTAASAWLFPPAERFVAAYVAVAGLTLLAWSTTALTAQRAAVRDLLTGCFGRGYALLRLEELLARQAFPFALGVLDLDGFKAVNDTFGHPAGDQVLRETSRRLEAGLRGGDLLARYGGDEFLVLWPQTSLSEARAAAGRLRQRIARKRFRLREHGAVVSVTLTVGVAEAAPGQTVAQLLQTADEDLYRQKASRSRTGLEPDRTGSHSQTNRGDRGGEAEADARPQEVSGAQEGHVSGRNP